MQIMDWFIDNDPDNEWSPKAMQDKVFFEWQPAIKKTKTKQKVGGGGATSWRIYREEAEDLRGHTA